MFARLGRWLDRNRALLCGALSALILAVSGFIPSLTAKPTMLHWAVAATLLIAGTVLAFLSGKIELGNRNDIGKLKAKLDVAEGREQATREALSDSIRQIGQNLSKELGLWSPDVRMTVYVHNDIDKTFIPLARVSSNPEFAQKHRDSYPDTQGFLAEVWRKGKFSLYGKQEQTIHRMSLEQGYSEDEYAELQLIPRSLFGLHLLQGLDPIGLIFWESPEPYRITADNSKLDKVETLETLQDLTSVLCASTALFPVLANHFLTGVKGEK